MFLFNFVLNISTSLSSKHFFKHLNRTLCMYPLTAYSSFNFLSCSKLSNSSSSFSGIIPRHLLVASFTSQLISHWNVSTNPIGTIFEYIYISGDACHFHCYHLIHIFIFSFMDFVMPSHFYSTLLSQGTG